MAKLTDTDLEQALTTIPDWTREGDEISRTFELVTFPVAIEFVRRVADLAEAADHHPDIDIRWRKVTLALTTHSDGGLTQKDVELAEQIDREVPTP